MGRAVKVLLLAVVAVPIALVLLIGAALSGAPAPTSTPAGTASPSATATGAAAPFTGTSTGCTVPDPTGTGGCVTPTTAWLVAQIRSTFGPLPMTCWDAHAWNPTSDHPKGRACDISFSRAGHFPDAADTARG